MEPTFAGRGSGQVFHARCVGAVVGDYIGRVGDQFGILFPKPLRVDDICEISSAGTISITYLSM